MADKLFEAPPRNEAQIIQAALRSGNFLRDAPSTRAALVRHMERMDDYERMQSDLLHQRIAPLRTLGHQTNERRRIAQTILNG